MNMNDNYSNSIDRSILRINQIVPEIMDRMLELYKAYAPKVLETLVQRFDENGGRLRAYKREFEKQTYKRYDFGLTSFLDQIPFTSLVKIVEPSLHKVLISKINEIASLCQTTTIARWKINNRIMGNNDTGSMDEIVSRVVYETEGFQKFVDFELTGIFPGRIPSYGCYNWYNDNLTEKAKDVNFSDKYNKFKNTWVTLPVIGVYNKFNTNLFNKLFTPEARTLSSFGNQPVVDMNNRNSITFKSKHLNEYRENYDEQSDGKPNNLIHQNIMLIDVDTIFQTITKLWRGVVLWNSSNTDTIDKITREKISKIVNDKALFPSFNHQEVQNSDIALSCKSFALLALNNTTSPEYKELFREFDVLHNYADKQWSVTKKSVVASAITTYLANVCSRTQDFSNNMLDDIVNKYLSITAQDNSIMGHVEKSYRGISTIRSKSLDFYSLFRNFLNTPSLSQRNMLNFDDIAISKVATGCSSFHMTSREFVIYLLKKIYEHECVTYNTVYNISNNETNFCFMQTESMMRKMLTHVSSPESKSIIDQYKHLLGNNSLLGHYGSDLEEFNVKHPLAYLSRNHRALSALYKQAFVSFINYVDTMRLKRNISKLNVTKDSIENSIYRIRKDLVSSLKQINELCCASIPVRDLPPKLSIAIRNLNHVTASPALMIGLFYDGKFNINYQMLEPKFDIILLDYSNRIVDIISPKNLTRNRGFSGRNRFIINHPVCVAAENDTDSPDIATDGEECDCPCDDCGDISYGGNVMLCDIDDLSFEEIAQRVGITWYNNNSGIASNMEINKTPYTDFNQFDGEIDSGLNSYESLNNKAMLKTMKLPSLEVIRKSAMKLNNLKIIKSLDLATIAYSAQLAYEQLDLDNLPKEEKNKALENLRVIDTRLREVLNGRIYKSSEEANMNSMESIEFKDII